MLMHFCPWICSLQSLQPSFTAFQFIRIELKLKELLRYQMKSFDLLHLDKYKYPICIITQNGI